MLLDEPTLGLDIVGSKAVFDYIDLLRHQNKAIIVSTHRLDEAQRLCDRFGLIFEGKLRAEGSLAELQAETGEQTLVEMFLKILESEREDDTTGVSTQVQSLTVFDNPNPASKELGIPSSSKQISEADDD